MIPARKEPLINTGALARWEDSLAKEELFQQFFKKRRKPLKRLARPSLPRHRAKAPVLMRRFWNGHDLSRLEVSMVREIQR